jgi:hypothetical protein
LRLDLCEAPSENVALQPALHKHQKQFVILPIGIWVVKVDMFFLYNLCCAWQICVNIFCHASLFFLPTAKDPVFTWIFLDLRVFHGFHSKFKQFDGNRGFMQKHIFC